MESAYIGPSSYSCKRDSPARLEAIAEQLSLPSTPPGEIDILAGRKPGILERVINGIETKYNIAEKYPDSYLAKGLKAVQNCVLYTALGDVLPGDAQRQYCQKAGIKETTLTKYSLYSGLVTNTSKLFGGYIMAAFSAGHIVPLAIGASLLTWSLAIYAEMAVRAGFMLLKKKPLGSLYIEIPYQLGKHGWNFFRRKKKDSLAEKLSDQAV